MFQTHASTQLISRQAFAFAMFGALSHAGHRSCPFSRVAAKPPGPKRYATLHAMNGSVASSNLSDTIALLTEHGYRITAPRRSVIDAVLKKPQPFTAEHLVAEMPAIGRSTIYRTLEILASLDILARLLQPGGHPAYVVGSPGHRHHLVCSECGSVVAFTRCPVDDILTDLGRDTEFAIQGHHLEIFGLCRNCQRHRLAS
jgi:Fe2+ or Zn2+ uptake regulation protein